ncbi:MAG: HAMP domain-containing sensor histidine kinase [Acidobacteriota bacterium]
MGTITSERATFLTSFRGRLLLLLTSFLFLTTVLVALLDGWAHKQADSDLAEQSQRVKEAFNASFGDFAQATGLAVQSLSSSKYLYEAAGESIPPTVRDILVTTDSGEVKDSTLREMIGERIRVPQLPQNLGEDHPVTPVEGVIDIQGSSVETYNIPVITLKGLRWIVVITQQEAIMNQIDAAQAALTHANRRLSNYRLAATAGLLSLALVLAVVIGWRFTQPIAELAETAHRVASGDLDSRVRVNRRDEVGRLAITFNEMIAGMKSKLELEDRLNQTERAAAIGRMTQSIAHDIRNPLNVLKLSLGHFAAKFKPDREAMRNQFDSGLNRMNDEVGRLEGLVNDLLDYTRPAQVTKKVFDLRELVEEVISSVKTQAEEQSVEILHELPNSPARVSGDIRRLKSCLSNIALNAVQAMPSGGRLTARLVKLQGLVELRISDTGVGMSEEHLRKIFEPYFSTKQTGFGLGLAVAKKVVEEHGGSITVESGAGKGTTFTIELPDADDELLETGEEAPGIPAQA